MKYLFILTSIILLGCGNEVAQNQETEVTKQNHDHLFKVQPPPKIDKSQERRNLIKRLERFNSDDKLGYIYLINFGKVMAFHTVQGKLSSLNSHLSSPHQIVTNSYGFGDSYGENDNVIEAPDLDGTYGENDDGVFWFDAEDNYHEWHGDYHYSDAPMKMSTPPVLVKEVK
jgi:hypothetical protein